jgi:hypothetical protein
MNELGPDSGMVGTEKRNVRRHRDSGRKREIGDKSNMEKDKTGKTQ